jgi:hypothetical protein
LDLSKWIVKFIIKLLLICIILATDFFIQKNIIKTKANQI